MQKYIILCQRKPRNGKGKKDFRGGIDEEMHSQFHFFRHEKIGLAPQKILQENTKEQFISF